MDWTSGTALWYSTGSAPLPIRWVLVRDPAGKLPTRAYFSTDLEQPAPAIIADVVKRWSIEKYGHCIAGGGMENQTMTTIGSIYLDTS